ncbi:conjugated bile salt MFS transporter [Catellicoccus marimammalium]|uniref:Putative transporter n=1 Tax=Catellicoccus marimammalium M35/04/3 TaxID=1234409 RepID=K8ZN04_9ENTE|nr:conjugated bile salt MFS transporter [Catellicoccus marimammalium]EKU27933.1 putative transporter [Catellicoccus marimammalium M35/04/3]
MSEKQKMDAKHLMIVFGCMLLQAIPYGIAQNVPPLFINYLKQDFGFSLASIGFIFTIGAVASSLVAPFGGKFYAKFSTKLVMVGGLIFSAIGLFLNAIATQLWLFYVANAIIQIGCVVYSGLGVPYLIGTWFDEKSKAKALGIAFAGGSIGNFFLQPLFANLLNKLAKNSVAGLHKVYLYAAIAALVVGIVVLFTMIHDRKMATSSQQNTSSEQKQEMPQLRGIGAAATRKLSSFWILASGMFFIGLNVSAQSMQYANYFDSLHLSAAIVGTVGSTFAIACLVGNVGGGVLFSKFGVFHSANIAFVLQLLSAGAMIVLGLNPHMTWLAYVWAVLYGFTVFIYMSGPAVIVQDLFGMKESSETLGIFSIFFAIGFAIGNVIFGFVADSMGYVPAWISVIVFIVIGYLILCSMIKKISKEKYAEVLN